MLRFSEEKLTDYAFGIQAKAYGEFLKESGIESLIVRTETSAYWAAFFMHAHPSIITYLNSLLWQAPCWSDPEGADGTHGIAQPLIGGLLSPEVVGLVSAQRIVALSGITS